MLDLEFELKHVKPEVRTPPTSNPRINVILEEPVYEGLRRWAKRDGVSLSLKVRDLVKDALEAEEDRALADLAKDREQISGIPSVAWSYR